MSQNDVRKSNDYYMNTGIQKTEIQKTKKSPFGILSFILFLTGILVAIFAPMGIYIGLGIELLSLIFAIVHIVLKKKGFVWLVFSILGCLISIGLIIIPFVKPDIYEISNKSLFAQLTTKEEPEVKKEPEKPVETETKKKEEFEKDKDYITNSNWQMINDKSCFYFLDSGSYYWCKDKDNFDDNYYYGQYTVYQGEKAIEKLNELKASNEFITDEFMNYLVENNSQDNSKNINNEENTTETEESITEDNIEINLGEETETTEGSIDEMSSISESESETISETEITEMIDKESISQVYFIEMTNDLCYMDGKDISIDYKKTKPVRYYCVIVDDLKQARGCDIEKFKEEGFIEMSKIESNNLSKITESTEKSKVTENESLNTNETIIETIEESETEVNLESQKNTKSRTTINKSSFTNPVGLDKE